MNRMRHALAVVIAVHAPHEVDTSPHSGCHARIMFTTEESS
jgi:hypothetical protein